MTFRMTRMVHGVWGFVGSLINKVERLEAVRASLAAVHNPKRRYENCGDCAGDTNLLEELHETTTNV